MSSIPSTERIEIITLSLSFNPHSPAILIILSGIAGLTVLLGALVVALIVKRWEGTDTRSKEMSINGDHATTWAKTTKLRYALLAFAFWFALSLFLILDIFLSASLYFRFVAIYTAFWVLIGVLLLYGRPMGEKILILGLFVIVASCPPAPSARSPRAAGFACR